LAGLSVLALISTVFGMMMAVASDLPALENQAEYAAAENSTLTAGGEEIAQLTGNQHRILIDESDVAPTLKNAVIAVEDRRFYEHEGVDYMGIARAFTQDVLARSAVQGGSTITQQFVKNALAAQGDRTVFSKLRESALAYHLERQWSKQKILTQYLNTVYFGNGAYGVESAMRTYFGGDRAELGSDERLATTAEPHEAALLAGIIASPSAYDPITNPEAALDRRDKVLGDMLGQGLLTQSEYDEAMEEPIPEEEDIDSPEIESSSPFFSTWVTQQLVDRYGAGTVFGGGLEIETTLEPGLQQIAEGAVDDRLAGAGPSAAVVTIENRTGEVKTMLGGTDFDERSFNLATNGHRQPGSAIKPFTLIAALQEGISPEDTFISERKSFEDPANPGQDFVTRNFEGTYTGPTTLGDATRNSDNSIFAEIGLQVGTERIAELAAAMGIQTPLSTNPAMVLGGLEQGVTPLEMAFAYSTLANDGVRRSGELAAYDMGPVGIQSVDNPDGGDETNELLTERVFDEEIAIEAQTLLAGVLESGTATAAQIGVPAWGKTGTTENYGDAWFVGSTDQCTTAVWVGYPDEVRPMKTEYNGGPVTGGSYPAEIWQSFMSQAIQLEGACQATEGTVAPVEPAVPVEPVEPVDPAAVAPEAPVEPEVPVDPAAPEVPAETAPTTPAPDPSGVCGAGQEPTVTGCVPAGTATP
jgi:penicillin-binding protein 1A